MTEFGSTHPGVTVTCRAGQGGEEVPSMAEQPLMGPPGPLPESADLCCWEMAQHAQQPG